VSIGEMERARHADEKGAILAALKEEYTRPMTSVRALLRALDAMGRSMRPVGLDFALTYLADCGYVRITRVRELPSYRADRDTDAQPDAIMFVKLLPKGLHLVDGQIAADPGVNF
jgi:hypothetical protein